MALKLTNDIASSGHGSLWKSKCVDILINEYDFKPWNALNLVEELVFEAYYINDLSAEDAVTRYIDKTTS